jgi:N-acyl-phosphatidylethanolamine-hydrolysing phospholipase D
MIAPMPRPPDDTRSTRRAGPAAGSTAALAAALIAAPALGADDPAAPPTTQVPTQAPTQTPTQVPTHHRGDRFQNNYLEFEPKGLGAVLRWKLDSMREGLPKPPAVPTPRVAPDLAFIASNAKAGPMMQPAVTWIGHASALVQLAGLNVLTDPVFSERVSPLSFVGPKRHVPPGLALGELPHVDLVLISHNHYDHLDDASVRALAAQPGGPPLFVVPLGNQAWMAERGITNVVALDWWQSHTLAAPGGPVQVMLTPAQHWSGRGLDDRMKTLWGSYAVLAPDCHLFFSGDTGYSKDFKDIHERLAPLQHGGGFDLALIAVGAYEPRWFMTTQHVNPDEAVQIHLDLAAKQSIGVHWGTFELTDESLDEPPRQLAQARRAKGVADEAFVTIAVGETRRITRRPAP